MTGMQGHHLVRSARTKDLIQVAWRRIAGDSKDWSGRDVALTDAGNIS